VSSAVTGQAEVDVSATVAVSGVDISVDTATSTKVGTVSNVKTWIAAAVTFTKTFEVGPFTSPGGTVCFTLSRVPAPLPPVSSDAAKQCKAVAASVTFTWNSLVAGAHTISEDSSGLTPPGAYIDISDIAFTVLENCTGQPPICVQASASPTPFNLGTFNDPLQPGRLQVLKLLGPAGTLWTGVDVTFYVCRNNPTNDPAPENPCDAGNAVETIVVTAANNPAASGVLEEAYYTVCEVVPLGFTVTPSRCQVVQVRAGSVPADAQVTFTNSPPLEGCTPGFWRGGSGSLLWNQISDSDWVAAGGNGFNPFRHETEFNTIFTAHSSLDDLTMFDLVRRGGGSDLVRKTARMLVAGYLNSSFGLNFGFSPQQLEDAWTAFVNGGGTDSTLFNQLAEANNRNCPL